MRRNNDGSRRVTGARFVEERAGAAIRRELDALVAKHLPEPTEFAGFCKNHPCLCKYMTPQLGPPPCIPCRCRAYCADLDALHEKHRARLDASDQTHGGSGRG